MEGKSPLDSRWIASLWKPLDALQHLFKKHRFPAFGLTLVAAILIVAILITNSSDAGDSDVLLLVSAMLTAIVGLCAYPAVNEKHRGAAVLLLCFAPAPTLVFGKRLAFAYSKLVPTRQREMVGPGAGRAPRPSPRPALAVETGGGGLAGDLRQVADVSEYHEDRSETSVTIHHGFSEEIVEKHIRENERLRIQLAGRNAENKRLQSELASALNRGAEEALLGDAAAQEAIAEARESGDLTKLKALLAAEYERHEAAPVVQTLAQRALELGVIAYLRAEWDDAWHWLGRVLSLSPKHYGANCLLGELELERGTVDQADVYFKNALDTAINAFEATPDDAKTRRDLAIVWDCVGDVRFARGTYAFALTAYESALELSTDLVSEDSENTQFRRDVEIHLNRIGNVRFARRDIEGALVAYEQCRRIAERLVALDPNDTNLQRDLSASWHKIGNCRFRQGDLEGALAAYEGNLEMAQELQANDVGRLVLQSDTCVSWMYIGDVKLTQRDWRSALACYERSVEIGKQIVAQDAGHKLSQSNLALAWFKVGMMRVVAQDRWRGIAAIERGLSIAERLSSRDQGCARWKTVLARIQFNLGRVIEDEEPNASHSYCATARQILEDLACNTDDPDVPELLTEVGDWAETVDKTDGEQ